MSVAQRFNGKRLLITGTTGFLGKVLLEKFLFSVSSVDKIYVLIRGKEGSSLQERFKKQIISSASFDRIRNLHGHHFEEFIHSKVQPIKGDLQKDRVGLSQTDYDEITNNCQIIINCAASIDFNARIDEAIDSNIRGSLRIMELARSCIKLQVFTHISTCYVNCNRRGLIKEEIYQKQIDPEEQYRLLTEMPLSELISKTNSILGDFPNTYTFTKNLCERLMKSRKKDLPLCIVRPAIINTSYYQPFPGWLDSIAAAAALYLFVGLGLVSDVKGSPKSISDTIPVDIVVANIIVATAYNFRTQVFNIYHVGSSDRNPLTWGEIQEGIEGYWNTNISQSKVRKAKAYFGDNAWSLKMHKWKRKLPVWIYEKSAPIMGKQHVKNVQKMIKSMKRGEQIAQIFVFFLSNQWIYESKNFQHLKSFLTQEEKKIYIIDSADIDMKRFISINNYGLQKYILKENVELPSIENSNLLNIGEKVTYFSDIKWAMTSDIPLNTGQINHQIKTKILASARVLAVIEYQTKQRAQAQGSKIETIRKQVKKQAIQMIQSIIGEIRLPVIRFLAWSLHKIFRQIYQKININMEMLETIRKIEEEMKIPIVLLPTHRSYIDFLVVSYIFFVYKLKMPYIVSDEALMTANLLPFLIKSSGAFFFRKKIYQDSKLYHIIFDKYVQILLKEGNNLEFFIEGTRSRTGKILAPQFQILNIIINTIVFGKVNDVCLIPLTINYEKVLEGDTFPTELLGEEKMQQSFLRVVKAIPLLRVNFGRVYVQICKPIFAKDYISGLKKDSKLEGGSLRKFIVQQLGKEIIYRMTEKIVIMSTGIVSSVLLMNRKGINEQKLIKYVNEISRYILKKGYKIGGINQNSSTIAVRNAIGYLDQVITKTKKDIFQLQIRAGYEFQKILMLSYYRNTLTHAFLPEAFIGCVMASFGNQLNIKEGISLDRLHQQSSFLSILFKDEYNIEQSLEGLNIFQGVIDQMQRNLVIEKRQNNKVVISMNGDLIIAFYCSLIKSQIQCYWASLIYIISIFRNEERKYQSQSLEKFFDTVQWFMESLYDEKVIEDYEACSLQSIKNAFYAYQKRGIIRLIKGSKKKQSVVQVLASLQELEGLEIKIKFFTKSVHNSILSPIDAARSSLKTLGQSKL